MTITAHEVLLRGRPVYLRRAGAADGPALVLLHGLPTSSYLWRCCLPTLAESLPGWCILAPDLPGYGRSAPRAGAGPRHLGRFLDATEVVLRPPTEHDDAVGQWGVRVRKQRWLIRHHLRLRPGDTR